MFLLLIFILLLGASDVTDLGIITKPDIKEMEVSVKNDSSGKLYIKRAVIPCPCLEVKITKRFVSPGKSVPLLVKFHSEILDPGRFQKVFYLETNQGERLFQFAGEIKQTGEIPLIRKIKTAEIGRAAVCPVMKSSFRVRSGTSAADYKGKSYYFCCAGCPESFKNNPEEYLN